MAVAVEHGLVPCLAPGVGLPALEQQYSDYATWQVAVLTTREAGEDDWPQLEAGLGDAEEEGSSEEVQFIACVGGRGGLEHCVHVWVRRYSALHVWLGEEVRSIACMSG